MDEVNETYEDCDVLLKSARDKTIFVSEMSPVTFKETVQSSYLQFVEETTV